MGWFSKTLFGWPEPAAYHARITENSRHLRHCARPTG